LFFFLNFCTEDHIISAVIVTRQLPTAELSACASFNLFLRDLHRQGAPTDNDKGRLLIGVSCTSEYMRKNIHCITANQGMKTTRMRYTKRGQGGEGEEGAGRAREGREGSEGEGGRERKKAPRW